MNERIRKLAEQAFFDENTNQPSDKMYTFTEHKMKQFAELIVEECVGIADEYDGVGSTIVSRIKKHFGVEE
ncbi:MAG: hypothetical protein EBY22_12635 [Gammaproteobacteria bacterium]|nr:hypothetical protein [Gammaproteobacteria bacterium]